MTTEEFQSEYAKQFFQEEQTFGIKNFEIILSFLRDKLYSNKIAAVCREIMCNARDANRESGSTNPILVTLSNKEFKVKDNGIGISPERIVNVYKNYGESTKRNDNISTGGFGLGSKTPWAYSDSFHVDTISVDPDGSKVFRSYFANIDSSGLGKIMLIEEKLVDNSISTGTEIRVPIRNDNSDINEFIKQSIIATRFWELNSVVFSSEYKQFHSFLERKKDINKHVMFSGSNWRYFPYQMYDDLTQNRYSNEQLKIIVLMDGIEYSIPSSMSFENSFDKANNEFTAMCLQGELHLQFDNGELSLAITRESIDQSNDSLINERLKEASKELRSMILSKFEELSSYSEAVNYRQHIAKIVNDLYQYRSCKNLLISSLSSWKDQLLMSKVSEFDNRAKMFFINKNESFLNSVDYTFEERPSSNVLFNLLDKDLLILYHQSKNQIKLSKTQVRKLFQTYELSNKKQALIINIVGMEDDSPVKNFISKYNLTVKNLDSLVPVKEVDPAAEQKRSRIVFYKFKPYGIECSSREEFKSDTNEKFYGFIKDNSNLYKKNRKDLFGISRQEVETISEFYSSKNKKNISIYLVDKKYSSDLPDEFDNLLSIEELKNSLVEEYNLKKIAEKIYAYNNKETPDIFQLLSGDNQVYIKELFSTYLNNKNHVLFSMTDEFIKEKEEIENLKKDNVLNGFLEFVFVENKTRLKEEEQESYKFLLKTYPMLTIINYYGIKRYDYGYEDKIKIIANYINEIDSKQ